jgi:hypothetical protein
VTLTMTIVAPWGVWQSADHRLVWIERGKATEREDVSVKHLAIRCPDGVALISYSGLGALDRKLHVSDWMRELVRGENRRTIDGTLIRIGEAVTSGLAHPRPLRDHRRASRQFSAEAGCGKGMEAISVEDWALLDRVKMGRRGAPRTTAGSLRASTGGRSSRGTLGAR